MKRGEFINRFWIEMDEMRRRQYCDEYAYCCDTWSRVARSKSYYWFRSIFNPDEDTSSWFHQEERELGEKSEEIWALRQMLMIFSFEYALTTKAYKEWTYDYLYM